VEVVDMSMDREVAAVGPRRSAVMYTRVSTKEQEKEGFSIEAQEKLLRGYARQNGFEVLKEFQDAETAKEVGHTNFGAMAHPPSP
jgi:DNA invertase Pin-like site-specific DNA recombinase